MTVVSRIVCKFAICHREQAALTHSWYITQMTEAGVSTDQFDARRYWESRLASNISLRGTGHRAFSVAYNDWLYAAQRDCVALLFETGGVDLQDRRALDVGSGNGYFVRNWLDRGARAVVGLDITVSSIHHLQRMFPAQCFAVGDVAAPHLPVQGRFDLVSCISVLYHVVDEVMFVRALGNLCRHVSHGGHLLVSDTFVRSLWPTARHARFRTLDEYRTVLTNHGMDVIDVVPVYYLLNRTYIPLLGPAVLNRFNLAETLYGVDARWRTAGRSNSDGMKFLLARRREAMGE